MKAATASLPEALRPLELLQGKVTPGSLDDQVLRFPAERPPRAWYVALAVTLTALGIGGLCICWTLYYGIGTWGNNRPVAWGFGIINFVFWVGIGHAGTLDFRDLVSAARALAQRHCPIRRGHDHFRVICAAIFPVLHTGRPWFATGSSRIPMNGHFG